MHKAFSGEKNNGYQFTFPPKTTFYPHQEDEEEPRDWEGMKPDMRHSLKFDSKFESGNLDMVVKRDEMEYDLYMRVDTNCRGHHQWFYFSVENDSPITKTIRFNIVNFTKPSSQFQTVGGNPMRISVLNEKDNQLTNCGWQRGGTDIHYRRSKIRGDK